MANSISCIFQDSNGFIWIATQEGVSKYDGYKFTNFTTANALSHGDPVDFFEADGKLYVGLSYPDPAIDAIQNNVVKKVFSIDNTHFAMSSFLHLRNGKTIFVVSGLGLYEYNEGKFYKPPQQISNLFFNTRINLVEINDSLLIAPGFTSPGANNKLYFINQDYRLISSYTLPFNINSIYRDSKDRTWACTPDGLKFFAPFIRNSRPQILSLPIPFDIPILKNEFIRTIKEFSNGEFWIGTDKGLVRIFGDGSHVIYTEKDGLPSKIVRQFSLLQDKENNIWIGTAEGIGKLPLQNDIRNYKTPEVQFANYGTALMSLNKNNLLLSTVHGLYQLNSITGRFKSITYDRQPYTTTIIKGSKPLMVFNNKDINYFDSSASRLVHIMNDQLSLAHVPDWGSSTDSSGTSFVAQKDGIAILKGKKMWMYKALPWITSLTLDKKGYLWASDFTGLYRIKYSSFHDSIILSVQNFSYLIKSEFVGIKGLFCDSKGNIWIATLFKGAFYLSPKNNDQYEITRFDQSMGLSSNFITSLTEAPSGDIWIGTYSGLDKLVKDKNGFRVFNFSRVNNFLGNVVSLIPADNNEWWCIADGEVVKFTDERLENSPPLTVKITSILAGSTKDKKFILPDSTIRLKHFQNQVQFTFSAPSYINEKQIYYSYRLRGSND